MTDHRCFFNGSTFAPLLFLVAARCLKGQKVKKLQWLCFVHQVVARYIEPLVAILIVANGVMIGFQTDPCLSTPDSNERDSRWTRGSESKKIGEILTTAR